MKTFKLTNYILFGLLLLAVGCVGTVEKAKKVMTESSEHRVRTNLKFEGIHELIPVAHDKMEVFFYPATGGSKEYLYQIYIGNLPEPVNVVEEVLMKDYRSRFRYTITGLDIGSEYVIKVDVKDRQSNEMVATNTTLRAFTFDNYVADFMGIASVSNMSGIAGIDSIKVRWPHATIYPSSLLGSDRSPLAYEITLLDTTQLTPAFFNDYDLTEEDGRIIKTIQYNSSVNEAVVRGLVPNRAYYVNVRAVHKGTIDDPTNLKMRLELNTKYFEIKTLDLDATSIKWDPNKYTLKPSAGQASKNSLTLNWGTVTGVFDHFRVYYALAGNLHIDFGAPCASQSAENILLGYLGCKKVLGSLLGTNINDLPNNSNFEAKLVVCLSIDCSDRVELDPLEATTGSLLAGFGGLQNIVLANSIENMGSLTLSYIPPNFTTGFFDGLAIEISTNKAGILAWQAEPDFVPKPVETWVITDPDYTGPYTYDNFNYKEDFSVTIYGVNYAEPTDYCFTVYPFIYDANGGIVYKNQTASWQCVKTEIQMPSRHQFEGLKQAEISGRTIFLNWTKPTYGVYTHYEIFYRRATSVGDKTFSFPTAIEATTVNYDFSSYQRVLVPKDAGYDIEGNPLEALSTGIYNLQDGYYNIGVVTYANLGNYVERSEFNQNLWRCHVNGSNADCEKL